MDKQLLTYIEELEFQQDILKAELSLHEFIKQAWHVIEGDKEFIDGWHIQAICEHLEAVANRQIKNLIINLPPRCMKSTIGSICFPAWLWARIPGEQFLYASYALSLSLRDSVKCRRLILSPWYQERWGDRYQLVGDQNTKGRFDNTQKGYRIASSAGSSVTGEGGSILFCDDISNALDGESEVQRENKIDWWNQVWSTRLNDKKNDCRVVIQQRIHERDITGYILSHDDLNEWTKLILPMEFEEKRKSRTVVLPTTEGQIWEDPRVKEGQLLWPERIDEEGLKSLKQALGSSYAIAGQLQQRPSPEAGGIIKKDWFQWWKDTTPPDIQFVLQSWDTAFSSGKKSAYSACTTWGVFYDHNYIENVILLSMWRGRVEYTELREIAKRLYFDYRDTGKERNLKFKGRPIDMCLIEAKASGDPLLRDLALAAINAVPFNPTGYGDKMKRVHFITPLIEGERVWLPARPPSYDTLLPFADEFLEAVACFPNLESNDLVDTMSQALTKLKTGMFLLNPRDERAVQPSKKEIKVY
jgi:phage terminase large subunit-like protein